MENTKSLWKLIGQLKKQKKIEVAVFYEEVPIKGFIEISEVDDSLEQIVWRADKRIIPPLKETRHIYFELNGEVFVLTVIAYDDSEIATSFPSLALDRKLNRSFVRVRVSENSPVTVLINNASFFADDISEAGLGIVTTQEHLKEIEEGKEYNITLNICKDSINLRGVVVYKKKVGNNLYRLGIKFTGLREKDRNKIARYIFERQREIAKKIAMFKT